MTPEIWVSFFMAQPVERFSEKMTFEISNNLTWMVPFTQNYV